jgi:hypothetical protein
MSSPRVIYLALLTLGNIAMAQIPQLPATDEGAYCTYLTEQAKAQSDLLRTPNAVGAFTQPDTGLPTQLVGGLTLSLSSVKKAGITLDAARKNCELYQSSIHVQQTLRYALPALEREALTNRLALIGQAEKSLQDLITNTAKMVDAKNMTRPMLWSLQTSKIKLDADRADTQSKIAAIYTPPLTAIPLKQQVEQKQSTDSTEQQAQDRLTRQNNWDVNLTVGAHQQINPVADNPQPFGEVSVTYNLGSRAIDRHLDRSFSAYSDWKKLQESDVVRGSEALRTQITQAVAAQQSRLATLSQESEEISKNLQVVANPDTTAALDFRNQLTSTQILLQIETGDAAFRLQSLKGFLKTNY